MYPRNRLKNPVFKVNKLTLSIFIYIYLPLFRSSSSFPLYIVIHLSTVSQFSWLEILTWTKLSGVMLLLTFFTCYSSICVCHFTLANTVGSASSICEQFPCPFWPFYASIPQNIRGPIVLVVVSFHLLCHLSKIISLFFSFGAVDTHILSTLSSTNRSKGVSIKATIADIPIAIFLWESGHPVCVSRTARHTGATCIIILLTDEVNSFLFFSPGTCLLCSNHINPFRLLSSFVIAYFTCFVNETCPSSITPRYLTAKIRLTICPSWKNCTGLSRRNLVPYI